MFGQAGMLQLDNLVTVFDHLDGIASRGEFEHQPLKSPLLFHEMQFLQTPLRGGDTQAGGGGVEEVGWAPPR
jgi:hypothetical protein